MANKAIRLAPGTITKAALDAGSSYLLQNFPLQSDMNSNLWYAESDAPEYQLVERTLSRKVREDGYILTALRFKVMTFGMISYFKTTFFTAANRWADVTVKVYSEKDVAVYVQGRMELPQFGSELQGNRNAIGYADVVWHISGTDIT